MPAPPESLRRGPLRRGVFTSRLRSPWLTARLGLLLGIAFGTCFVTGLLSHGIQHPPGWLHWPAHPVVFYRVTQGVHVATGLAAIPLLTAKLWSVYPKLFAWPPARDVAHALERAAITVLIAAAWFQLVTGVLDITYWYGAMPFAFIASHFWGAWLAIGALLVHLGFKLPIIRNAFARHSQPAPDLQDPPPPRPGLSRRGLLGVVGGTVALITVATVGQTLRPMTRLSVLAPRVPDIGPQGFPVNTTAIMAAVTESATDPAYRLVVSGPGKRVELALTDLRAMAQQTIRLPISCVEGWSASADWTGVRFRDLLQLVGASGAAAVVRSLQQGSASSFSILDAEHADDDLTLLALGVGGEPLDIDHGYPCRLIAPNRPGTLQTKWVASITAVRS